MNDETMNNKVLEMFDKCGDLINGYRSKLSGVNMIDSKIFFKCSLVTSIVTFSYQGNIEIRNSNFT